MARTARIVVPGGWYYITSRGIERRPIFKDDRDRIHFLELLAELAERFRLRVHAYVLMENHYHLLAELPQPNLSRAIQWLNLSHTAWFNGRHGRVGSLFQDRFKSIVVDPVGWGLSLSAYIHLNPVRLARLGRSKAAVKAGRQSRIKDLGGALVRECLAVLRSLRWSSYRAYALSRSAAGWLTTERVLELVGGRASQRRAAYRAYVEAQIRQGKMSSPWESLHEGVVLGARGFVSRLRKRIRSVAAGADARSAQWARDTVTFQEVVAAVEKARGERWVDFRDRHGDGGRNLALHMGRRATNLTLLELAKAAGLKGPAQAAVAIRRHEARVKHSPPERRVERHVATTLGLQQTK